jgi:threonine/homoserine/homoserine lactone efflux protein
VIAGFGLTVIRDSLLAYQDWLGSAGGIFLLVVGLRALLTTRISDPEPLDGEALVTAYASTFALTITNPITILAFAAIFAKVGVTGDTDPLSIAALVAGVFLGSLLWWLGLSFGIDWLRRTFGSFQVIWLNRVSGVILTLSGAALTVVAALGLAGRPV